MDDLQTIISPSHACITKVYITRKREKFWLIIIPMHQWQTETFKLPEKGLVWPIATFSRVVRRQATEKVIKNLRMKNLIESMKISGENYTYSLDFSDCKYKTNQWTRQPTLARSPRHDRSHSSAPSQAAA